MRIIVIGANGQLGVDVCKELDGAGHSVCPITHDNIDIASLQDVDRMFRKNPADIVINTSAMHNVQKCEEDFVSCHKVNAIAPTFLAMGCKANNATLLHISTDYVFAGEKRTPYTEYDQIGPLNEYGKSKAIGEAVIRSILDEHFIVRVSGLYGHSPCRAKGGMNFVELMIKLAGEKERLTVVEDKCTPTSTVEVARQIVELIKTRHFGTYHCSAEGECTWNAFAKKILELTGSTTPVDAPTTVAAWNPNEVSRPAYSVMENAKLNYLGLNIMKPWDAALVEYLQGRNK